MKYLKILLSSWLFLSSITAFAGETFFSKNLGFAQDFLTKILGEERVNKLYGIEEQVVVEEEIKMPVIPKVIRDSKSTESTSIGYNKESRFRKLTPEQLVQLDYQFVRDLNIAVRGENPSDAEISRWLNTLTQGGSREGIYRAMVLDHHYAELEAKTNQANDEMAKFCVEYYAKYAGAKISEQNLKEMSRFTVKRLVTEKILEVFDELKKKPEDVYAWYALMNAEFATKHAALFYSKIQKETNPKIHLNWAKEMPEQILKSEIIIKLHTILNTFK